MGKIKNFFNLNKLNILILFLWVMVTVFTMFHHEIWRDEAQVWCIARDLNMVDIFNSAKIEGHPLLWYIIVYPFAKLGFPVESMQIISLILVFVAVSFLLFKSPFNYFEKVIVSFSAGLLYYLPIVARNYALIPIVLFLIASLYPNRAKYPFAYAVLIILLSQTHIYMLGLCGILFVLFIFETIKERAKKNVKSIILMGLNFIVLFFIFNNTQNGNYALENGINNILPFNDILMLMSQVFVFPIVNLFPQIYKYFNLISLSLFIPIFMLFTYLILKADKKIFLILFFSTAFILYVFTRVYFNGILYQKIFLILLILIFCYWLYKQESIQKSKLLAFSFNVLFFISLLVSPIVVWQEVKYDFSSGKQIAYYIKNNLNDEKVFIAFGNPYLYSSISAYLPDKKLYSIVSSNYISYYSYNSQQNKEKVLFPSSAKYYIVHNDIEELSKMGFKCVYSSENKVLSSKTQREVFSICTLE